MVAYRANTETRTARCQTNNHNNHNNHNNKGETMNHNTHNTHNTTQQNKPRDIASRTLEFVEKEANTNGMKLGIFALSSVKNFIDSNPAYKIQLEIISLASADRKAYYAAGHTSREELDEYNKLCINTIGKLARKIATAFCNAHAKELYTTRAATNKEAFNKLAKADKEAALDAVADNNLAQLLKGGKLVL